MSEYDLKELRNRKYRVDDKHVKVFLDQTNQPDSILNQELGDFIQERVTKIQDNYHKQICMNKAYLESARKNISVVSKKTVPIASELGSPIIEEELQEDSVRSDERASLTQKLPTAKDV